jgi:hypothetical protein
MPPTKVNTLMLEVNLVLAQDPLDDAYKLHFYCDAVSRSPLHGGDHMYASNFFTNHWDSSVYVIEAVKTE